MEIRRVGRSVWVTTVTAASLLALGGCHLNLSNRAEARDQLTRHYTLAPGGTLEIRNTNGLIRIDATDGNAVDVTADRIVQAPTDQGAKDALAGYNIQETITPDRVVLDSANGGLNINLVPMSRRVEYHVRVPQWVNIKLVTTNGDIDMAGPRLTGTFQAEATNGRIKVVGIENSATVETTNGTISVDVTALKDGGVSLSTTNGAIMLTLPAAIKARLSARVTNGTINQSGLDIAVAEQSRHRLDGTIGGGGPMIKLETTNGLVQIKAGK